MGQDAFYDHSHSRSRCCRCLDLHVVLNPEEGSKVQEDLGWGQNPFPQLTGRLGHLSTLVKERKKNKHQKKPKNIWKKSQNSTLVVSVFVFSALHIVVVSSFRIISSRLLFLNTKSALLRAVPLCSLTDWQIL